MRYAILFLIPSLFLAGCIQAPLADDIPIGDSCTLTCEHEGYGQGSCMRLSVQPDPCETERGMITPPNSVAQCTQGEYDGVIGVSMYCCCELDE